VGALDRLLGVLESQPCAVRRRFAIRSDGHRATIQRGSMQAVVHDLGDGTIEVAYEHALHETTRELLTPEIAARLLLAVIQREELGRVEVPDV
jgi:hypothetical protein